jgi:hypothetical protein
VYDSEPPLTQRHNKRGASRGTRTNVSLALQTNPSIFCALLSSLCAPEKTSRSVTHPEIAPGQTRLTLEFFADGLPEKKLQLSGISMLLILLSRGMLQSTSLRRPTSSSVPKPGTSPLGHVRTSSIGIRVPHVQLAAYVPCRVPPRGPTRHAYVPTSLTRTRP